MITDLKMTMKFSLDSPTKLTPWIEIGLNQADQRQSKELQV